MAASKNHDTALIVVAAGALINPTTGRVLMQQRPLPSQHGGLWEFPGGKREAGETLSQCLVRELAEELGIAIDPMSLTPAGWSKVSLADGELLLMLMICRAWEGEPLALDGATLRWCDPAALCDLPMPPADVPLAAGLSAFL